MNRWLALLLAAFILLGAVYAVVTPLFEVSDELWHYPMVKTLADGHGLPVQDPRNVGPWRQEGSQPPLYYAVMAAATFWIDTRDLDQVRWINPHTDNGLITEDGNNNIALHPADEITHWTGTALAVRLIRLLSVLLGAVTVYCTYRLALEVWPERAGRALAAAAITAFTPMFLFISASVNNDNLAIAVSAASVWLLARWLRRPPEGLGWGHVALGVLLGAGALSKQSALGLAGLAGLVLAYVTLFQRSSRAPLSTRIISLVREGVVVFGLMGLIAFWWYLRNWQLYGDWLGWNTFVAIVGPRAQPATLWQLWGERVGFVQAYWGLFGGVSVPMPDWAYTALNLVAALAGLGLAWGAVRWAQARRVDRLEVALYALLIAWIGVLLVGLVRWSSITWASQGRLIFPAISALSVLLAAGLGRWWRGLPGLFAGGLAVLAVAVPPLIIAPHYTPPAALTPAQLAAIPQRADVDFGGELKLLGYELRTDSLQPGGAVRLTLYWQSQIAMDRNWSVFVHVVDEQGVIVAQRDRYPGQGLWPTTWLRPGQTWADAYVIPVPLSTFTPAAAHLEVGLYDLQDGARLPASSGGDTYSFGALALRPRPAAVPLGPASVWVGQNLGGLIELSGYDLDRRALRPGEALTVKLYWRALAPIAANYSVSARVRGADNARWAAHDAWPQAGQAPTASWRPGSVIQDPYTLTLDPATPPGQYDLEIVVYDSQTLTPLRAWTEDGRPTDAGSVILSHLRVLP